MGELERELDKVKKLSERMVGMRRNILTKSGRLQKKFLPAVYLDSSVLIDYWIAEGMESWTDGDYEEWTKNEPASSLTIRELLKSDVRLNKVVEIRKKFIFGSFKITPVVTPLSILELMEWNAESALRQHASDWLGAGRTRKIGRKNVGDYLKKALELRKAEVEISKVDIKQQSTGLEILIQDAWLNRSFAECHGLQGLLQVDIRNFDFTIDDVWQEPSAYALLQLGMADIIHVMIAEHLDCNYFASFDDDFKRIKSIMKEETGMTLLSNPEEILDVL